MKAIFNEQGKEQVEELVREGIDPIVAQICVNRGFTDREVVFSMLNDGIEALHHPELMTNLPKAGSIIVDAILNKEKICIFGDYDADGITATAILYRCLSDLGADVFWRLPDRLSEGYGMSEVAVKEAAGKGCQLMITVDNGIRCHKEIELAKSLGMRVIVLDHHAPGDTLPTPLALVNPHVEGETYPFIDLAGCGIAFKMACYLYDYFGFDGEALHLLDLAAIGTVGDVVPLVGENRVIVKEGLRYINSWSYNRPGVVAIMEAFQMEPGTMRALDIGFKVAPILNAPGRILEFGANAALELLLMDELDEARNLVEYLMFINEQRKEATRKFMAEAEEYIQKHDLLKDKVLVLFLPECPEGVVGLISGRITEKYHRPSLVFAEARDCYKASGRSTPAFDLYKGLCQCDDLFLKYGGHPQAAGMSIAQDLAVLEELRKRINEYADTVLTDEDIEKKVLIDIVVENEEINDTLLKKIDLLEPYGERNPRPILLIKDFQTRPKQRKGEWTSYFFMGAEEEHLKLYGVACEAIGFDLAERYTELEFPCRFDVVGSLGENYFLGNRTLQVEILDIKPIERKPVSALLANVNDLIAKLNVGENP